MRLILLDWSLLGSLPGGSSKIKNITHNFASISQINFFEDF